jgi:hypothetical protein
MRGLVLSMVLLFAWAHSSAFGQQPKPKADTPSAAEIGHKLANPLSDTWAIFGQNDLLLFSGDLALNDMKTGVRMIFQPIIPLPLYGEGDNRWMLVSRPQIPILWDLPVPRFIGDFRHVSFLGDLRVPLLIKPPTGQVLFALGPDILVPTANKREFSNQQWGLGPGLVGGYMTKKFVTAFFLQYYWESGAGMSRTSLTPTSAPFSTSFSSACRMRGGSEQAPRLRITAISRRATGGTFLSGRKWRRPCCWESCP